MSLAMYAAPFNENSNYNNDNDNENIINRKRQTHNKTQKIYSKENFDTEKVNSVLEKIHSQSNEEEDEDKLGDFNPPPPPQSAGVNKTITTEQMTNMTERNNQNIFRTIGNAPEPDFENNNNLELNNFNMNYGDKKTVENYYKNILPNYSKNNLNKLYYNSNNLSDNSSDSSDSSNSSNQDVLLKKINYMIHLLEEKQDERTNNVTEEVILYSFLGIFIIFIVDSFARAGKYVR